MPLLLVFALIAACRPIDWPEPPLEPLRESALALSGGAVAIVLLTAFLLRCWVVRTLRREPHRRVEVGRAYGRLRRALFFVNLATAAGCVLAFGWGWYVQHTFVVQWTGKPELAPFADLAVPMPYFVILVGCWIVYFDAERALHRAQGGRAFPSRLAHLLHNARQFVLLVMLPVGLLVTQQTLDRFFPELTNTVAFRAGSLAVVPFLILLMPFVMKPLLGLKPMPAGELRDRIEALAKRLNFRCTDFLLWPTHGAVANAMIAGLLPRARYVVFTDRILEEMPPDELDAVLGHEIGHARHGHLWLYALFLALSFSTLAALALFILESLKAAQAPEWIEVKNQLNALDTWLLLPPLVVVASYLFVVFGALSRRCERQADVFGCKAVSCGNPTCTGHDGTTHFPPGGRSLCPTGILTFTRALQRVYDLNGMGGEHRPPRTPGEMLRAAWAWIRHWQHAPIPLRIAYLKSLIDRPYEEPRFQRRVFLFKCVLLLALAAALVALGQAVGWKELFDSL